MIKAIGMSSEDLLKLSPEELADLALAQRKKDVPYREAAFWFIVGLFAAWLEPTDPLRRELWDAGHANPWNDELAATLLTEWRKAHP